MVSISRGKCQRSCRQLEVPLSTLDIRLEIGNNVVGGEVADPCRTASLLSRRQERKALAAPSSNPRPWSSWHRKVVNTGSSRDARSILVRLGQPGSQAAPILGVVIDFRGRKVPRQWPHER
jgi:hypothetical protein